MARRSLPDAVTIFPNCSCSSFQNSTGFSNFKFMEDPLEPAPPTPPPPPPPAPAPPPPPPTPPPPPPPPPPPAPPAPPVEALADDRVIALTPRPLRERRR